MEVDWKIVLGDVMTQALRIILPFLAAVIIKWAVELYQQIKANRPDIASILAYFAEQAVFASEQIYGSGHGETKKEYAMQIVQGWLDELGLRIDVKMISDAIEAEVYRQFHLESAEE